MSGRILRRHLRLLLLCLAASALVWSWIFTLLTDAPPSQKLTLYADMKDLRGRDLAIALEARAPEGIRFVQARPFSYALMDGDALRRADLYIMTAARAAEPEYADWFAPLPEELAGGENKVLRDADGQALGLLLYDAESGRGAAEEYLNYGERPGESWYLFFGASGAHGTGADSAAVWAARELLRPEQKKYMDKPGGM